MTSNIVSPTIIAAITAACAASGKAAKATMTAVDLMVAQGWTSAKFVSPSSKSSTSTATPEEYSALRGAVIASFSAQVQKLLALDIGKVKPKDKAERKYWQQQIGARLNDFKTALAKREKAAQDGGAGGRVRSIDVWLDETYDAILKKLSDASEAPFDIAHHKEAIGALQKMLKAECKVARNA